MIKTPFHLWRARAVYERGGIIAYPTEGVWGLGCDPFNPKAVERLLRLKSRPWQKGLILAVSNIKATELWLTALTEAQRERVLASWPGPTTWLVPHLERWPTWVCGESSAIAMRVSAYEPVALLSGAVGGFIISTSANPAGLAPAMSAQEVRHYFGHQVDLVMPGTVQGLNKPSAIKDALTGEIARA